MINVLLLGVGGNVSQGILKALRHSSLKTHVVGACISPYSSGLYLCDESLISPFADDDRFTSWVIDVCLHYHIDIILTGVEEIILSLAKNIGQIHAETGACFVSSSLEQLTIGQDKYLTCRWLKEHGCNYPDFCMMTDHQGVDRIIREHGFPLIVKPLHGKSAAGVSIVHSASELAPLIDSDCFVLQEIIGSEASEYTVGCYVAESGWMPEPIIMQRRLKHGTTVYAKVVNNTAVRKEAEKICSAFHPRGPLNIQMRQDVTGRAVCFELNVRFSGTTAMRANFGFCDVEALLREYILKQQNEDCFHIRLGEAFRYDNEFYLFQGGSDTMISCSENAVPLAVSSLCPVHDSSFWRL
ncbi:MAG: ATP-grasp domain-containing protein [Oscillospiraceae bacterium]|nr:ATP-grasp domain-containing protein [Oscillospiraceae bacterium]